MICKVFRHGSVAYRRAWSKWHLKALKAKMYTCIVLGLDIYLFFVKIRTLCLNTISMFPNASKHLVKMMESASLFIVPVLFCTFA